MAFKTVHDTGQAIETTILAVMQLNGKSLLAFYGMSSDAANTKHFGGLKDYRSSEGREVLVPYRGSVSDTVQDLLGGIRSTCTYAGAMIASSNLANAQPLFVVPSNSMLCMLTIINKSER